MRAGTLGKLKYGEVRVEMWEESKEGVVEEKE